MTTPAKKPASAKQRLTRNSPVGEATRRQIIDVGERLFAERGLHGVSLRDIVSAADVNIAAINYHFDSKERLFHAVFERAALRFAEELDTALDDALRSRGKSLGIADVIQAFIEAGLDPSKFGHSISSFLRLRAWAAAENSTAAAALLSLYFDRSMSRYMAAARRACPWLTLEDAAWRFHVLIATLVFTANHGRRVTALSGGSIDADNRAAAIAGLVPPLVAAFEARSQATKTVSRSRSAGRRAKASPAKA